MPLIIEDEGKLLGKKQAKVPDKLVNKIKQNLNLFGQYKKSKGFKRASSIVDDDYNKRSNKKDKIHNGDKTLSFSDIKKIDHEYKNMSVNDDDVNAKNLGYILPGGNDMKNWAHDTLRKMRTAVKKVDGVPPVPKLETKPTKPEDVQKSVKMGNATVRLTEEQLLVLKEYHDQLVFNFDDNGEPYYKKDNWQHYIDFLEKIGKYGQLPPSEWDENDIRNAVEEEKENLDPDGYGSGVDEYEQFVSFSDLVCETIVMNKYKKEDIFEPTFLNIFEQGYEAFKENNNYYDECETITKYLESLDLDKSNLDGYLTVYGYRCFTETLRDNYYDNQYDYGFIDSFTFNDRGLLYIERNIKNPKFNSPDINDKGFKNFFAKLNNSYCGIGTCFSWREGKGESYCGSGESELKLKCWVDPKNVNWYETLERNCYSLREEQEIYIDSDNAVIEVFDIVLEHGRVNGINVSGKSLLKSPILVGV